jgi:chemotaxis response regulator CheB
MIKTLIVDDSPLVRSILKDFLESEGSFEIAGEAENGQDALETGCVDLTLPLNEIAQKLMVLTSGES